MAGNRTRVTGRHANVAITSPAAPNSGDSVIFGRKAGVAQVPKDANGLCVVDFEGEYLLTVTTACAAGDNVWAVPGNPVVLSSTAPGVAAPANGILMGTAKVAQAGSGIIPVILGA